MTRILILNGHPDGDPARLCAGLASAYGEGGKVGGHEVRRVDLARLDFQLIANRIAFESAVPPADIQALQDHILWAEHLVIIHPLWLGAAPARLKGLFEQTFRYGFALGKPGDKSGVGGLLKGRSARPIVTMGMPAAIFRLVFGAFGVRATERGILFLCGFRPIRHTLLGGVEAMNESQRKVLLDKVAGLGRRAT